MRNWTGKILPRVGAIRWATAVEVTKVHCQSVMPLTRADVSSLPITGLLRMISWIICARSANGSPAVYRGA